MENSKKLRDVSEVEMREHFDAIDEAARLRRELKAMQCYAALLERNIEKRDAMLDMPIEIVHSDFDRHGEIMLDGAIIGR